jgi:hypothetical protein
MDSDRGGEEQADYYCQLFLHTA